MLLSNFVKILGLDHFFSLKKHEFKGQNVHLLLKISHSGIFTSSGSGHNFCLIGVLKKSYIVY